jgi:hypothetical protein
VLALVSCGGEETTTRALVVEPTPSIRRWLLCEECTDGELDSVLALGDRAVDPLASALIGPPLEGIENIRRQVQGMYARAPVDSIDSSQYMSYYLGNYVALYQRRAAVALDSLDTPRAREVLTQALRQGNYRDDVLRVLGRSAGISVSLDSGAVQHAPLDSLVRVNPTVLVRDPVGGPGLSGVQVRFRVDSGGGWVSDSMKTTDASGRASVQWRVGPADSVNVLSALAAGRVLRFRALASPMGLRLVFVVQPGNVRSGDPMAQPVRIAIQDAWGATQVHLNDATGVVVIVEGTGIAAQVPIVNGVAGLSDLQFHGSGRVRITARRIGLPLAHSAPFEILSP